eukprot:CAMPEP_0119270886 /NCGR_PEP_ID=MMETSP1329-20130426/7709_1 /TAXON_ID=114041 /ORGANISM="Genus nov. species nov., Strain RCC1024" /LENGTH=123 /DNA_ID=CAMNT_0007270921 /DNA_START=16 /DNA_END=383 /DNA_ORIENTATION=-
MEVDAGVWAARARDLCDHRERLVGDLRALGRELAAGGRLPAGARTEAHRLLRDLREAACHVCEAAARAAGPGGALPHNDCPDYLAKMAHDLDFAGEDDLLVAAIGTLRPARASRGEVRLAEGR